MAVWSSSVLIHGNELLAHFMNELVKLFLIIEKDASTKYRDNLCHILEADFFRVRSCLSVILEAAARSLALETHNHENNQQPANRTGNSVYS
jgi:hypothetical protein